jgi:phosphate acetyltransferase
MSVIDEIKNKAKANKKTVVLPETTDMRTLTPAATVPDKTGSINCA